MATKWSLIHEIARNANSVVYIEDNLFLRRESHRKTTLRQVASCRIWPFDLYIYNFTQASPPEVDKVGCIALGLHTLAQKKECNQMVMRTASHCRNELRASFLWWKHKGRAGLKHGATYSWWACRFKFIRPLLHTPYLSQTFPPAQNTPRLLISHSEHQTMCLLIFLQ
jgi:hypothetical protein